MQSTDPEHLAHLLLVPCHLDLEPVAGNADLPAQ
jgi:hypothetical protein